MTLISQTVVIAVFPNTRGFAYSVFEGLAPIDWGISDTRGRERNEVCLRRVLLLLERYAPSVLVLRDSSDVLSERSDRVRALINGIDEMAAAKGLCTLHISRRQVREAFDYLERPTRYAIVQAISQRIAFLEPLAPHARKIWKSEDRRMGLFDAMALALTFLGHGMAALDAEG